MSAAITQREQLTLAASLMTRAAYQIPTSDPATFDIERKETLRGSLALARRSCELIEGVLAEVAPELLGEQVAVKPGTQCECRDPFCKAKIHDGAECQEPARRLITLQVGSRVTRNGVIGTVYSNQKLGLCEECASHHEQVEQAEQVPR